jgi:hypothetical protein
LCQYQLVTKKNPAPDLLPALVDNPHIDKYVSSNYFGLIGVCKAIGQTHPLSLLVTAKDCMAQILSFLKPASLFPELLKPTDLLPTSFSCISKAIDQTHPLSLFVAAKDCMTYVLSFLKPTSLFPELLKPTDLLPTSFFGLIEDKPMIGSVVEETDS